MLFKIYFTVRQNILEFSYLNTRKTKNVLITKRVVQMIALDDQCLSLLDLELLRPIK